MNLIVIEMYFGPIISKGVDDFLFEQIVDPILPGQGLPIPVPIRAAAGLVKLQLEAGKIIASGGVAGMYQYTGQDAQAERAQSLGMNLIYQPGGIQV